MNIFEKKIRKREEKKEEGGGRGKKRENTRWKIIVRRMIKDVRVQPGTNY